MNGSLIERLQDILARRDWPALARERSSDPVAAATVDWGRALVEAWLTRGHLADWSEVERRLPTELISMDVGRPLLAETAQAGRHEYLLCLVESARVGWGWTDQYELGAMAGVPELMRQAHPHMGVFSVQRVLDRAVVREDVATCARVIPDAYPDRRLNALHQATKQGSVPLIHVLAPHVFSEFGGQLSNVSAPFETALESRQWDVLAALLDHASSRAIVNFDLLVTACRAKTPVHLMDRMVDQCARHHPQEQEDGWLEPWQWGEVFIQATRHGHVDWIRHAWAGGRVSEARRATAMMTEAPAAQPEILPLLVQLGDAVDLATLLKLAAVAPEQDTLDRVGVLLPPDLARSLVAQSRPVHHGKLPLTRARVLAEDRHDQAIQTSAPTRPGRRQRS